MHRACCSRIELTSPVIKSEDEIRRLLHLYNQEFSFRGMDSTWSNMKHITLLRTNDIKNLFNSAIMTSVIKFLSRHVSIETGIYL